MHARATSKIGPGCILLLVASLLLGPPALAWSQPPTSAHASGAAVPAQQASLSYDRLPAHRPRQAAVTINLCAATGSVTMPDSTVVPIWGFSRNTGSGCPPAQLPGPVLDVSAGDTVTVNLTNVNIPQQVALVFPGQPLIPNPAGAAAGGAVSYTFTASNPGTYLYESSNNKQVLMGLSGALIVRPGIPGQAYTTAASAYTTEAVLVLSEVDPAFNASPTTFNLVNYAPKYWLINGKAYPQTAAIPAPAGGRLLLRYLNAGSLHHTMALLGAHQRVIARDAYPLAFPYDVVGETIAAGQTTDAIATIPATAAVGSTLPVYSRQLHLTNAATFPGGMLTFVTVQASGPPPPPPVPDLIFADGFESGSFSAWSAEVDSEGDLNVTTSAALVGTRGMAALIDNTTAMYVRDNTPVNEPRYRARFYFDPNSITMANGNTHRIMVARNTSADVIRIEFRRNAGVYQVRASVRNDGSGYANTAWFTIADAPHRIEIDWKAATSAGANNGYLSLWIDNSNGASPNTTLSGVDNDTLRVEDVRLGPLQGIDAGTSGTEFFDEFVSRRTTFIGP